MNEFPLNNDNKARKEKSMYILNLDTPRIIIITSVFIGLIVLAVLAGMNINKDGSRENGISANDTALLDSLSGDNETKPLPGGNIDETPLDEGIVLKEVENGKPAPDGFKNQVTDLAKNKVINDPSFDKPGTADAKNSASSDILTHENIESIIPPVKEAAKVKPKKVAVKSSKKPLKKEAKKQEKVVEVSSADRNLKAADNGRERYSIQVASFDKKPKAQTEVSRLEKLRYNAYIADGKVDGKNFFRVRIGPIYSQEKASELLNDIQSDESYEESYMIKE
jgi:cell division septation protein DedD